MPVRPFRAAVGLVFLGCATACARVIPEDAEPVRSEGQEISSPPPTVAEACPGDRYAGRGAPACPQAGQNANGTWKVAPVFPGANEPLLAAHCVYLWGPAAAGGPPDTSTLPPLGAIPALSWLGPDCMVAAPLADYADVERAISIDLSAASRAALGAPSVLPKPGAKRASVRVAVVDTSPKSVSKTLPVLGQSRHGYAVARRIQAVACGSSGDACPVTVPTWPGLPRISENERDLVNGGFFGSQLDVADAIWDAVRTWRAEPRQTRPAHLVLNLSLGWDGTFGGPLGQGGPSKLRGPVRAVFDALIYASCSGAIVIVAAGNDGGGPVRPTGPMYPAGWERFPAPTAAKCAQLVGKGPGGALAGVYAPLVHAVGNVDASDAPATNARASGMPRLVAPGVAVSTHVDAGTALELPGGAISAAAAHGTEIRTGTSMSAAAVSGAAALLWSYVPSLPPEYVMELLYYEAEDVAALGAADFCLGSCTAVSRLDVCGVVGVACMLAPAGCSAPPSCTTAAPSADASPALSSATADLLAEVFKPVPLIPVPIDLGAEVHAPECGTGIGLGPDRLDRPCVDWQFHGEAAVPFALPQPGSGGDPEILGVALNGSPVESARIRIHRDAALPYPLEDASLVIALRSGERFTYALGASVTASDSTLQFELVVHPFPRSELASVSVAFTTPGARIASIVTPAVVTWD